VRRSTSRPSAPTVSALWERLRGYIDPLQEIYPFTKGVGLAAPQIGVSRAMLIVRPPNGADDIALINPTVVWESEDQDEKYEGCLSFFDVRRPVARPLKIRVQLTAFDIREGSREWQY
jgi:peptide deformylase